MNHFEIAKKIWNTDVPKTGQSKTVEGELIRSIEKLRWEAQNNGNANWDIYFGMFCEFIKETLINHYNYDYETVKTINASIIKINTPSCPYLNDDVYDYLTTKVIEMFIVNGTRFHLINENQIR